MQFELLRRPLPPLILFAVSAAATAATAQSNPIDAATIDLSPFQLRHLGPLGNRVPAVSGVPGDPLTYFAGAASGGLFRSQDGGTTWHPVFDDQPVAAIGSIAVAPSDPQVIWVGTGESFIRSNIMIGNGVYRSTDGGDNWRHLGLEASGRIGRIVVDPNDADVAFAAALGHAYGPQAERGLYRTRDGGETWEQVLFVDENTGAIDVLISAGNPRIVFAATWQFQMSTSGRTSGGPGSGLWRSADGGDSWERLGGDGSRGLPKPPWGKIGLAQSAAAPERVWALIETSSNADFAPVEGWDGPGFQGVLWRTDDGGDSWRLINRSNTLTQRPLYYTRAVAAPDNANEITFMAVQQSFSIDGGKTFERQNSGWDHHDLWIDPADPDRRIAGHDGGVSISLNRGETWSKPQLPIAQIYHVNVDDRVPYNVYGNRQDGPTMRGPSRWLHAGGGGAIPLGVWQSVGGCEVGFAVPTPGNADVVWSGCYDGILERYDEGTGQSRDVSVWPLAIESWAAADVPYRFQWNFPITISPHDPETVYVGSQFVHRTADGGQSWQQISPDLTTADPTLMERSGGLTLDDAGPTIAPVIFSIAESPLTRGLLFAGTNDGQLQHSRDGGGSWDNLTSRLPDLPPLGSISSVHPSRHDEAIVYVTVDRHQEGDNSSYLFRSDDGGDSWTSLRSDLPQGVLSTARVLIEDPKVGGLLYLGTNSGLWVSFDDGASWRSLRGKMAASPVSWITVQQHFGDLVVSTYGRGFWVLDDLAGLRRIARAVPLARRQAEDLTQPEILTPDAAYRFRGRQQVQGEAYSAAAGANPPSGVPLHVVLPPPSLDGVSTAELVIARDGRVLRRIDLELEPGVQRHWWNLYGERTPKVLLRTPPVDNPELPLDAERQLPDGGRFSRLEPPATYQLSLELDGEPAASAQLELLQDPNAPFAAADLAAQQQLLDRLRDGIERGATLVNRIEELREQLAIQQQWLARAPGGETESTNAEPAPGDPDLRDEATPEERTAALARGSRSTDLAGDLAEADSALQTFENVLFDLRLTPAGQDSLRWQRRLYARLTYLARRVDQSDHRPTEAQQQLARELLVRLDDLEAEVQDWADQALPSLRERLAGEQRAGALLSLGKLADDR